MMQHQQRTRYRAAQCSFGEGRPLLCNMSPVGKPAARVGHRPRSACPGRKTQRELCRRHKHCLLGMQLLLSKWIRQHNRTLLQRRTLQSSQRCSREVRSPIARPRIAGTVLYRWTTCQRRTAGRHPCAAIQRRVDTECNSQRRNRRQYWRGQMPYRTRQA